MWSRKRWESEGMNKNETKRLKREGGARVEGQGEGKGVSLLGRWWGVFSFVLLQCVCANTNLRGRAAAQNKLSISHKHRPAHRAVQQRRTAPSLHNKQLTKQEEKTPLNEDPFKLSVDTFLITFQYDSIINVDNHG